MSAVERGRRQRHALRRLEIEGVDGDVLAVKSRAGEDVKLHMTGDMKVVGITKTSLSDIKVGSFIGATTVPGPDGGRHCADCGRRSAKCSGKGSPSLRASSRSIKGSARPVAGTGVASTLNVGWRCW